MKKSIFHFGKDDTGLPGNSCSSKKSTAWSSRLFEVCLQMARNRSTTNCLQADVERNFSSKGFKILSILFMCYFPNIAKLLIYNKSYLFYG